MKCYECNSNTAEKDENCETGVSRTTPLTCPPTTKFCDYVKLKVNIGFGNRLNVIRVSIPILLIKNKF
jgi:hypothetical protein